MDCARQKNGGFSLVELLVVVAIIVIFTGLSYAGLGLVQSGNIKSATENIGSGLTETRMKALTQTPIDGWYLSINKLGDSFYVKIFSKESDGSMKEFSSVSIGKCTIKYSIDGVTDTEITDGMTIGFKSNDGSVNSLMIDSAELSVPGSLRLTITLAGRTGAIELFCATGKYEVE